MITGFSSKIFKKYDGSTFELMADVVDDALHVAGIEKKDIDGLLATYLTGTFDGKAHNHFFLDEIRQYLGIRGNFLEFVDFGGPSALAMVYRAEKAIKAGDATNVICIVGGKGSDVRTKGITVDGIDKAFPDVAITPFDNYFRVYDDLNPVTDYALVAERHKHLYGSTDEERASIAVHQRYNASGNEKALYKEKIKVEDVLGSPAVADPLHLLEIVYPVDGFHVFIVGKRAKNLNDVDILGYGEAHWSDIPAEREEITFTPAIESSKGIELNKVDAFELYDSFTVTVMLQIEDIGLAEKGKGGKLSAENDLTYKGNIPVNTGGGSLNLGQPAYMSGGVILEEALLQLNGMAKGHQVEGAKTVFINGIGGWNRSHSVSLLLGEKK
ncbi:thiolase family protein [Acidianus sp. RZ1]|uniref:thiolase family protein n=1 Tax=Acidianus sp. RZ1 TaxID=1540082 RepID=UPI0014921062|nr:thiolase family protein [Acidianus sp. RZ1]